MPIEGYAQKAAVTGADGLTPKLKTKSRARRERQRALAEIADHAPKRRNDLLPSLSVSYVPIDELRPALRRVRRAEAEQVARVRASIEKFGVCQPILIGKDRTIVHGHGVVEAARAAGLTQIPAIFVEHLSAAELRLLSIALNRTGETGRWDEEALRIEFAELIDLGEDVVVSGFEAPEIDFLLLEDDSDGAGELDPAPAVTGIAVSRPGDLWILGRHRLLQADARNPESYQRLMLPSEQARLVLTDEPYNVPNVGHVTSQARHREFAMAAGEMSREEFVAFNRAWMSSAALYLVDGGLIGTFIDWRSVEQVLACGRDLGLDLINVVVWSKSNARQGSLWRSQHELLPVFKKGDAAHVNNVELGRHGRWRSNVWTYPGGSTLGSDSREGLDFHPTVKPRVLLEDALLDVTNRDDIVIDCFAGSGSTLLAAEAVGRRCRAVEIDGLYCDVIIRRWREMTGATPASSQPARHSLRLRPNERAKTGTA
jgi:DNA modification methylase